jgi:hypothetical protein
VIKCDLEVFGVITTWVLGSEALERRLCPSPVFPLFLNNEMIVSSAVNVSKRAAEEGGSFSLLSRSFLFFVFEISDGETFVSAEAAAAAADELETAPFDKTSPNVTLGD